MDSFQWHDFHVHTRPHSPDAHWRAKMPAMLRTAANRGVTTVGLANHLFPTTDFAIFPHMRSEAAQAAPKGMTVLIGAELCVLDQQGNIQLTTNQAKQLDFILAGPHHFKQRWVEKACRGSAESFVAQQHQMLLNAARNPLVDGIAHPWVINVQHAQRRWGFSPDQFLAAWRPDHFAELGAVATEHKTAIEIGMGIHLMAKYQGEAFWQAYVAGLMAAKNAGTQFYFGSDAHHLHIIARLDWLRPTLQQLDIQPHHVITHWAKRQ